MNTEAKILVGLGIFTVIVVVILGLVTTSSNSNLTKDQVASSPNLVRASSHKTNPNAKVTLVEFGDFQCSACEIAFPTVTKIEKDYGGKVNFIFRNFPLPQHANALPASEAAEAAGAQGKYFAMYEKLYTYQADWVNLPDPLEKFTGYAKDLGLDVNKFKEEVSQKKYADVINQDQSDGNSLGVNSTPTFFLNGEKIVGVKDYNTWKTQIDTLLK